MQNNYTQEMADLGIKPQAGMICRIDGYASEVMEIRYIGELIVVVFMKSENVEQAFTIGQVIPVKPEKSPLEIAKEKQVEEVSDYICSKRVNPWHNVNEVVKMLQDAGLLAEIKL